MRHKPGLQADRDRRACLNGDVVLAAGPGSDPSSESIAGEEEKKEENDCIIVYERDINNQSDQYKKCAGGVTEIKSLP